MGNKKYLKALFTNPNFYAGLVFGLLVITAYAVCSAYGYIDKFVGNSVLAAVVVDILFALTLIAFYYVGFKKLKSKTVSFSEAFVGFLIANAIGGIYLIIAVKSHVVTSVLLTILAIVSSVIVVLKRSKYYDHKYDVIDSNATLKTYYQAFFKSYGVVSILLAIAACASMILIEKADIVGHVLHSNSLKLVAIIALVGLFVLFGILYVNRLHSKEIAIVDVALFMAIGAVVGLIPVVFMVGKIFKVVAIILLLVALLVVGVLSYGLVKNTHVYTAEEDSAISDGKSCIVAYIKALNKESNIIILTAVSLTIVAMLVFISGIGIKSMLLNVLKMEDATILIIMAFSAIVLGALFVLSDIKDKRITAIDSALFVWTATFTLALLLALIFNLKGAGVVIYALLAGFVIGVGLVIGRSVFIKHVEDVVIAETAVEEPHKEVKEEVKEEPVVEEAVEEVKEEPKVEEVVEELPTSEFVVTEAPQKLKNINVKKDFETYIRTGDDQLKANYSAIKNAFYSYGVHSRPTKTRENFSKKGNSMSKVKPEKALHLQATLQVRGKFVKLYINLDPTKLDAKYFRHKDVSAKSPDQATMVKIRSKLTLKRAIELIDMLAVQEGYTKKKKFEEVDYTTQYSDENLTYMQKLGFDYMIKDSVTLAEVMEYNDEFAKKLLKTKVIAKPERYIYDEISTDALADNFAEGEVADLEAMRVKGLIKINANSVKVVPGEKLAKKLIVVANIIDPKAVEMIAIAGGESTQLVEG